MTHAQGTRWAFRPRNPRPYGLCFLTGDGYNVSDESRRLFRQVPRSVWASRCRIGARRGLRGCACHQQGSEFVLRSRRPQRHDHQRHVPPAVSRVSPHLIYRPRDFTPALLGAAIAIFVPGCRESSGRRSAAEVNFWVGNLPYTSDPLAGNEIAHGILSGAVHVGLVSDARKGAIQGRLAKSWTASPDMTTWTFHLRSDLTFDNGDPITSETLRLSWERAFTRLSKGGSRGGVFGRLVSPPPVSQSTKLPGVSFQPSSVTLSFKEPYPTLLNELSEPHYSVVHPSCIPAGSDEWTCQANPVTSGAYRIVEHSDQRVDLALRTDFPREFLHPKPLARIAFKSASADRNSASMIFGLSADRLQGNGLHFHGGALSGIVFGRCQSWSLRSTLR